MMDRKEAMERMIGPVPSISIPFTQDGEVDYRGLADFVEFLVANKTSTLLITLADSLFSILSDAEIEEITRVVTRQNRGEQWWLPGRSAGGQKRLRLPVLPGMRRGYGNHCARGLGAEQQ
ncbi:MAG: hypothetical protein ACLSBB_12945 [Ruthenibacterium lactatiformans]